MRDREAYVRAPGRSDPHSPAQMLEHPYDFVSLPDRPAKGAAVDHGSYPDDRWSGVLSLVYRTESPLHVGSGVFEMQEECGLGQGRSPVRGILRSRGKPVLPGSSWKGAVRARFEAITNSTLALAMTSSKEPRVKVPEVLRQGTGKHTFQISDPRVQSLQFPPTVKEPSEIADLSPADALFGCLGYRGRVLPMDGEIEGPKATEPLAVAALDSPQMHRLAPPGDLEHAGGSKYRLARVEGRKFYYDGDVVHYRAIRSRGGERQVFETIDHIPEGCKITIEVRLVAVTQEELGALLVSAGYGEGVGVVRFGGYKPAGLGRVRLEDAEARFHRGHDTQRWHRPRPEPHDLDAAVAAARRALVDEGRLKEVDLVTTMKRPAT
jgi:hypothetical protein